MVLSFGCFLEAGNDHLDRREFAQEHSTHSLLNQLALGTGPVVEIWYDFAIDKIDNYHVYGFLIALWSFGRQSCVSD